MRVRFKLVCPDCKGGNMTVRTDVSWDYDAQCFKADSIDTAREMQCWDCDKLFEFNFVEVQDVLA